MAHASPALRRVGTTRRRVAFFIFLCWAGAFPAAAADYAAQRRGDIVQLEDNTTQTVVSIVPSVGDIAFQLRVKGQNVLHWPYLPTTSKPSRA
jgi:aldose 1-epimerase